MESTERVGISSVKDYYGKILKTQLDLKTNACCTSESLPHHLRSVLQYIHPEVTEKFYGCGSPIPLDLEGKTVLDLGSGSGRDSYILSKLVGPNGQVIGIDMTEEQIAVAKKHLAYHQKQFDYHVSNVSFHLGYIEDLKAIGIETDSVDVVISNCVINLSVNKERVFSEIFRVLKPGGELYFSDIFANRRIPKKLYSNPMLVGECLGGALYIEDFRRLLQTVGCNDYRVTHQSKVEITEYHLAQQLGRIEFTSLTVRAFKLNFEDRCEDYGQVATYLGTIPEAPDFFILDDHHLFERGRPANICGNTALMLQKTRYNQHFLVSGDMTHHFGLFDCSPPGQFAAPNATGSCC